MPKYTKFSIVRNGKELHYNVEFLGATHKKYIKSGDIEPPIGYEVKNGRVVKQVFSDNVVSGKNTFSSKKIDAKYVYGTSYTLNNIKRDDANAYKVARLVNKLFNEVYATAVKKANDIEDPEYITYYQPIKSTPTKSIKVPIKFMSPLHKKLIKSGKLELPKGYKLSKKGSIVKDSDITNTHNISMYALLFYDYTKHGEDGNEGHIMLKMNQLKNIDDIADAVRMPNNIEYLQLFKKITFFIVKQPSTGGCNEKHKDTHTERYYKEGEKLIEVLVKVVASRNNNCLINCFTKFLGLKASSIKPDKVRKNLNIPLGTPLHYSVAKQLSDYFGGVNYVIYNQQIIELDKELIENPKVVDSCKSNNSNVVLEIMLMDGHYNIIQFRQKCNDCLRKYVGHRGEKHICKADIKNFVQGNILKKKDIIKSAVNVKNIEQSNKIDYDNKLIIFDIETFAEQTNKALRHTPYAVGYYMNKQYKQHYGQGCFDMFVDEIVNSHSKIFVAYNGANFDFHLLINALIKRGVDVPKDSIILNGRKIMSFKFGKKGHLNKFFDPCLFLMCSLKDACKSFNTEISKSEFEHSKMKCWGDVEKYRNEVEPYLYLDVMSLREVFIKFNDQVYDLEKVNITRFITIAQMSYSLMMSEKYMKYENIEIPKDIKKYRFIRESIIGGRTLPMQKYFESEKYNDIVSGKLQYDDLEDSDFLFAADATSLYPTAMKGYDLLKTYYPIGESRWSNNAEQEYKNSKYGIYDVLLTPPTNIRLAYVPKPPTKEDPQLKWSLEPFRRRLTNIDIEGCIECGYKVNFVGDCLVYDVVVDDLFEKYVDTYSNIKIQATKDKNNVKKSVAKMMLNSPYGKLGQRKIDEKLVICKSLADVNNFFKDYDLTYFDFLDDYLLLKGTPIDIETPMNITKPNQLSAFVLSWSRRIMLNYFKAIDPTLQSAIFYYTDTDSMYITGSNYKKLKELGYIVDEDKAKLGYLCSDIKGEAKIIRAKFNAPKNYANEFINNKNELFVGDECKMKCKGIVKNLLSGDLYFGSEMFGNLFSEKVVEWTTLKKTGIKPSSKDSKNGIGLFDIKQEVAKRKFNEHSWNGGVLVGNDYYPYGHEKLLP